MLKFFLLIFLCIGCVEKFEIDIGRISIESLSHPECEASEDDPTYPECMKSNVVFNTQSDCGGPAYYTATGTHTYGKNINPDVCQINYEIEGGYTGVIQTDSTSCTQVNGSYVCDYALSLTEAPDYDNFTGTVTISCPDAVVSTFNISASAASAFTWEPPACAPPPPPPPPPI